MTSGDLTSWPFWAPSDLASVEAALDLADLAADEVLVDLGCGDGQVLVAAARRGARVVGVESDPELVVLARGALEANDLVGEVIEGDLFDADLVADVYFSYLAPATLQRLLPGLSARHGVRLVSVDFDVPGLVVDEQRGAARLYRMPGRRRRRPPTAGWTCAGALVVAPPGHQSLTVLDLHHPGGTVAIRLDGEVSGAAALLTGADRSPERGALAVDLRWDDHPEGTVLAGSIVVDGLDPLPLFAVFDPDAEEGCWELSDDGVDLVVEHLRASRGATDGTQLVRAAEG